MCKVTRLIVCCAASCLAFEKGRQQNCDARLHRSDVISSTFNRLRLLEVLLLPLSTNSWSAWNAAHHCSRCSKFRAQQVPLTFAYKSLVRAPVVLAAAEAKTNAGKTTEILQAKRVAGGSGVAPDVDPVWPVLAASMESQGGETDALELAECEGGLRGIRATRDIQKGETVMLITPSLLRDKEETEKTLVSKLWVGFEPDLPLFGRFSLGLLYEQRLGKASNWATYIASLPSLEEMLEDSPAIMWEPEEVALAENYQLAIDAQRWRDEMSSSQLLSSFTQRSQRWKEFDLPGEPPSNDEVWWAIALCESRSFGEFGFVPGLDLVNHHFDSNTEPNKACGGKGCMLNAKRDIKKGEQVFHSYTGGSSNLELLEHGGFMLPSNPHELTLVHCGAELAELIDPLEMRTSLLEKPEGGPAEWQPVGPELRRMIEVLVFRRQLPVALLHEIQNQDKDTMQSNGAPVAVSLVQASATVYAFLLRRTLASFSSTAAEARATLAAEGSAMPPRRRVALSFRVEQQELLERELDKTVEDLR